MFGALGPEKLLVLIVLALLVFGPERLPGLAQEAAKGLRQMRKYLADATADLKEELGPELGGIDLAALRDPTALVRKVLWDEDDPEQPLAPPVRPTGAGKPSFTPLSAGELPPWDPDTT